MVNLSLSLRANPFEFPDEPYTANISVLRLSIGEDFLILACVVLTTLACDKQTDGQTDRHADDG